MSMRPPSSSLINNLTGAHPSHRAPPSHASAPSQPRNTRITSTTSSTSIEPPPAPSRPTTRNLAASHLARRPPSYSTARPPATTADTSRRPPQQPRHVQLDGARTSPHAPRTRTHLDIAPGRFGARSRSRNSRSRSRNGVAAAMHRSPPSTDSASDSSDNEILIADSPASTRIPFSRATDLMALVDGTAEQEWTADDDADEEARVIEMWKGSKGYRVDVAQVRKALEVSARRKVDELSEDGWMFGESDGEEG
ncbi:MAG: hypothetical protein Q9159_007623 [Coniocarpon cinnabarinum]